ncbi:MAG: phosphonate metabolism protein PhnP [Betaproteobacteria bacterium]|nr:phosphonate metabolism protein PhnP [Betaproteobacteria bacterium]
MRVSFLGTGAAGGVPLYGCACLACEQARVQADAVRRPCCALIETTTSRILLDAGLMDIDQHFPLGSLDAIVLTHFHPDHVQGLFHLRWGVGRRIPVWGPHDTEGCADLYRNPGLLQFHTAEKFNAFQIGDCRLTPLPLIHSKPTVGYAIEGPNGSRFAYLTDTLGLPPATEDWLRCWGEHDLAIDCSFPAGDIAKNHNDWAAALGIVERLRPQHAWLTHIGHTFDEWRLSSDCQALPSGVSIAADGERVELRSRNV